MNTKGAKIFAAILAVTIVSIAASFSHYSFAAASKVRNYKLFFQSSGVIAKINVQKGSVVRRGDILAQLDQSDAAISISKARANLELAKTKLQKTKQSLNDSYDTAAIAEQTASVLQQSAQNNYDATVKEQQTKVDDAYTILLNSLPFNVIAANSNLSTAKLTITGSYSGVAQGSYKITLNNSGGFSVSGIENISDNQIVPNVPLPLGTKGLYVSFSVGTFLIGDSWTVQIPNVQSILYQKNLVAYQDAVASQAKAIAAAQGLLDNAKAAYAAAKLKTKQQQLNNHNYDILNAQASLQLAQAQLDAANLEFQRNILRAPANGTITELKFAEGDYVDAYSIVLKLQRKKVSTSVNLFLQQ